MGGNKSSGKRKSENKIKPATRKSKESRRSKELPNSSIAEEETKDTVYDKKVLERLSSIVGRLGSMEESIEQIKNDNEITARRLEAIEKSISEVKNGKKKQTLIGTVIPDQLKTLNLPVTNLNELQLLNTRLDSADYFDKVVQKLSVIGGQSGNADGNKIVARVVYDIISKEFMPEISWTGRGKGSEIKIPLQSYSNIFRAIATICQKADNTYDAEKCQLAVIYRVIKRANKQKKSNERHVRHWKKQKASQFNGDKESRLSLGNATASTSSTNSQFELQEYSYHSTDETAIPDATDYRYANSNAQYGTASLYDRGRSYTNL